MSNRRVELQHAPDRAWQSLQDAARKMGKIEEQSDATRFLVMKARYGLNPVRLRVTVLSGPLPSSSILEITGRGQDVMGVASRKVIDKLILALR